MAGLEETSHAATLLWVTAAGIERRDSLYISHTTSCHQQSKQCHIPPRPFQFTCYFLALPFSQELCGQAAKLQDGKWLLRILSLFCVKKVAVDDVFSLTLHQMSPGMFLCFSTEQYKSLTNMVYV